MKKQEEVVEDREQHTGVMTRAQRAWIPQVISRSQGLAKFLKEPQKVDKLIPEKEQVDMDK